jgi:hypothetical protein
MHKTQMVYVMYNIDTKRIKIGITGDIKSRLNSIITASGSIVVVLYVSEPMRNAEYLEGQIHNELKEFRVIGEWFNVGVEVAVNTTSLICKDEYRINGNEIKAKIIPLDKYKNIGGGAYCDINGNIVHICFSDGFWVIS